MDDDSNSQSLGGRYNNPNFGGNGRAQTGTRPNNTVGSPNFDGDGTIQLENNGNGVKNYTVKNPNFS